MTERNDNTHAKIDELLRDDRNEATVFRTCVDMLQARGLVVTSGITPENMWYLWGVPKIVPQNIQDAVFTACDNTLLIRSTCSSMNIVGKHHNTFIETFVGNHTLPTRTPPLPTVRRLIIITNESRTLKATERLYFRAKIPATFVEIFTERSLRFNVLRHRLVPSHRPLSRKEIATLAARYRGTQTDKSTSEDELMLAFAKVIPIIDYLDPVARFLGAVPARCGLGDIQEATKVLKFGSGVGTIFEITRPFGEISYRVTVADIVD